MPGLQNLNGLSNNMNSGFYNPSLTQNAPNSLMPQFGQQNNPLIFPQQRNNQGGFWDSLKSFFLGSPESYEQISLFNPQQSQAFSSILQQVLGQLGNTNNQPNFDAIENQARQDFSQKTIPSIAERFSSLGSGGSQQSSAFQNALGSAGSGLESNLAAQRSQFNLQNQGNLQNLLRLGLTPQFETNFNKRQPGHFENNFNAGLQNIGKILPFLL